MVTLTTPPSVLERVGRIEDEIEQHLLDAVAVGENRDQVGREHRFHADAGEALVVGDQAQGLGDESR